MITINETIETKKHEDGFGYDLHKRKKTNEAPEVWAEVYPRDEGPQRLFEGLSLLVRIKDRQYKLVGEEVVLAAIDPPAEEFKARIDALVQKFIDKGVHVFLFEETCDDCGEEMAFTYLFALGHGLYDAGCREAHDYICMFCELDDDRRVIRNSNPDFSSGIIKETARRIIRYNMNNLEGIEEWLNAGVPSQV